MKKDDHYLSGSLLRSFGTKGEILLIFNTDLSENIKQLESIFIDVDGKLVPFFIVDIKKKSLDTAVIRIKDLDSDLLTQEFLGADFYLSKNQLVIFNGLLDENIDVTGYEIKDQKNQFVGSVLEFIDIPDNPLLKVKINNNEVLLPANDDLIIEVDDDQRYIALQIPDGLIDND